MEQEGARGVDGNDDETRIYSNSRPDGNVGSGALLSGTSQIVKVCLQFVSTIVMARLLEPADFGLWAMVIPAIGFVAIFQEAGLHQAIVYEEKLYEHTLTELYWFTLLLSMVTALVLIGLSPLIGLFFQDVRIPALVAFSAAPILIQGLSAQHHALLTRSMQFRALALIDVLVSLATLVVGLLVAAVWATYWAFAAAALAGAIVSSGLAWQMSGWRPGRPRALKSARPLIRFGVGITGANLLNYVSRNADNVIIARTFGPIALGYYDRAYRLMLFPLQNVNAPAARVIVPLLSRRRGDSDLYRATYLRSAGLLSALCMPGIAAAMATAEIVVRLLLGPGWSAAGPVFAWLAFAGLSQPLNSSVGWLLLAQGRVRLMIQWGAFGTILSIVSFLIGTLWGLEGVAAAYAIGIWAVKTPAMFLLVGQLKPLKRTDLLRLQMPFIVSAAATYMATPWFARHLDLGSILTVAFALIFAYTSALALLAFSCSGRVILLDIWTHFVSFSHAITNACRARRTRNSNRNTRE